ncbi:MAG: phage integrase N-terminal SAM-like domain-containing protein [Gammaproteobacteria bacterium]
MGWVIRAKRYSIRTEQAYVHWIRRFILFHKKRHPAEMGAPEAEAFLSFLAVERRVAAATQNQALNAIVFLYRQVLKQELGEMSSLHRGYEGSGLRRERTCSAIPTHFCEGFSPTAGDVGYMTAWIPSEPKFLAWKFW